MTTFLCANCGDEVRMEWAAPGFGLCESCEELVLHSPVSFIPIPNLEISDDQEKDDRRIPRRLVD